VQRYPDINNNDDSHQIEADDGSGNEEDAIPVDSSEDQRTHSFKYPREVAIASI
jgi:hypothetical protein